MHYSIFLVSLSVNNCVIWHISVQLFIVTVAGIVFSKIRFQCNLLNYCCAIMHLYPNNKLGCTTRTTTHKNIITYTSQQVAPPRTKCWLDMQTTSTLWFTSKTVVSPAVQEIIPQRFGTWAPFPACEHSADTLPIYSVWFNSAMVSYWPVPEINRSSFGMPTSQMCL